MLLFGKSIYFYIISKNFMAQIAIREYDAKRMFAAFQSSVYCGYLIDSPTDFDDFDTSE